MGKMAINCVRSSLFMACCLYSMDMADGTRLLPRKPEQPVSKRKKKKEIEENGKIYEREPE